MRHSWRHTSSAGRRPKIINHNTLNHNLTRATPPSKPTPPPKNHSIRSLAKPPPPRSSSKMSGYQTSGQTNDASAIDIHSRAVTYICGDCDSDVTLKRGEPIRCRNCGHRVLYKKRTNR